MSETALNLRKTFLKLSRPEQLELMQYFLEVFASTKDIDENFALSIKWKNELDRRDEAYLKGESKGYSLEDILSEFKL